MSLSDRPSINDLDASRASRVHDAVMRGRAVDDPGLARAAVEVARRSRQRLVVVMLSCLIVAVVVALAVAVAGVDGQGAEVLRRLALFIALLPVPFVFILHVNRRAERHNASLLHQER